MDAEKLNTYPQVYMMPTTQAAGAEWIAWHKSLKARTGKSNANAAFVYVWGKRAGAGSSASTNSVREYMKTQGVELDTTKLEDITDFGYGVWDGIGSFLSIGKKLTIGLTILAGAGLVFGLWAAFNKRSRETAGKVYKETPYGRAGTALNRAS